MIFFGVDSESALRFDAHGYFGRGPKQFDGKNSLGG